VVIALWIYALVDIIRRRRSLSGGKLAAWLILIFVLPVFGTLVYLLVNGAAGPVGGSGDTDRYARPGGGLGA